MIDKLDKPTIVLTSSDTLCTLKVYIVTPCFSWRVVSAVEDCDKLWLCAAESLA